MKNFRLEKISLIAKKLKKQGKTIGLCHGVFDIIHAGHIDHFEDAKKKCDYLFVTITEDKYVNKGPNRPINNHYFRAKILDSLKHIDYVGINYSISAIESIRLIKPDFYFKGKDYKNNKDLTSRLNIEKKAVNKNGGKMVFTNSPLKSSTDIINKNYSHIFDSKLQKYLSSKNKKKLLENCKSQLEKVKKLDVLIIGDAIIDQYDTIKTLNKPIKETILASKYLKTDVFLGGVFAAAVNLSQFNSNITLCTAIGKDKDVLKKIKKLPKNIKQKIFVEKDKITTRKKRYVDYNYNRKLSEIYYLEKNFLSNFNSKKINDYLKKNLKKFDVVIMIDYGHDFFNKEIYKNLKEKAKFLAINCQTNSANMGFNLITKYQKCDYICIDEPELKFAASNNTDNVTSIVKNNLMKKINCKNITITQGSNGCTSFNKSKVLNVPALISDKVIDTIGAGDVFLVISSILYSVKSNQLVSSLIGNIAGALKVDILGHSKSINKTNFYSVLYHILK